ncbi:MAG: right-handed parallel beta-helix repeat-containing protein, partial [Spirochaetes bacterium]|nr:right-handed parallel beta-helix repeat-containing protein [Spirochaetota bacterium]
AAALAAAALVAVSAIACSGRGFSLVSMKPDIASLLPDYDREAVAARRAAILAGGPGYVTVGATGCDYADLAEALESAPSSTRAFYLMDPVHRASGLRLGRDAAIIGFGARDTVLEAASAPEEATSGVIGVEAGVHAYVSGVTIRGGRVTEIPRRAGGVSNSGSLVMEDCAIIDNRATYGVGVWTEGRLELRRCVIAGNRGLRRPQPDEYNAVECGGRGSALRVEKGGFALVEDCLIAFNEAVVAGGALHVSCEGAASLVGCTIYGNTAPKRGGAIDLAGGALDMARCTVAGNSSGGKGQALFHRGLLSMESCLFYGNGAGKAYYLADDKGGEYGRGIFKLNEGNFDDSGSLPLAATGDARFVRANAGDILTRYGSGAGR